jgi:hypothetical protein
MEPYVVDKMKYCASLGLSNFCAIGGKYVAPIEQNAGSLVSRELQVLLLHRSLHDTFLRFMNRVHGVYLYRGSHVTALAYYITETTG